MINLLNRGQRVFALDFYDVPAHRNDSMFGNFVFGKAALDTYMSNHTSAFASKTILWSERQFRVNSFMWNFLATNRYTFHLGHRFTIYDLKMCNTSLMSNYSSNWQAEVNTRIEGLGLPEPFYYMVQ